MCQRQPSPIAMPPCAWRRDRPWPTTRCLPAAPRLHGADPSVAAPGCLSLCDLLVDRLVNLVLSISCYGPNALLRSRTMAPSITASAKLLDTTAIRAFAAILRGPLIQPGDPGYDAARTVWNAMIDRYPALIVRCAGAADVTAGVTFAR